jgi:hypothetical protein
MRSSVSWCMTASVSRDEGPDALPRSAGEGKCDAAREVGGWGPLASQIRSQSKVQPMATTAT